MRKGSIVKKNAAVLVTGLIVMIATRTIIFKKNPSDTVPVAKVDRGHEPFRTEKPKIGHPMVVVKSEPTKSLSPWDYYQPLSADEKMEFEAAEAQVEKFLTWGRMDPEAVPAFRQTLFKMGDRAIADLARGLSEITEEDIANKADAESIIHKVDALAYFANSNNPLAADSVEFMAKRPIVWNGSNEIQNPVEANITFEMFDIFSCYRPEKAAQFITTVDKKYRQGYFTHYAYGRKLAGKTMDEIDNELRTVFGSPELALK